MRIALRVALLIVTSSVTTSTSTNCPQQYSKLCPHVGGGLPRYSCVLATINEMKMEQVPTGVSLVCETYIRSLLMARSVAKDVAAKPFDKPAGCRALGHTSEMQAAKWDRINKVMPNEAVKNVDFTLVTQMSANRYWMMNYICERWIGDIVAAVYIAREHLPDLPNACLAQSTEVEVARQNARLGLSLLGTRAERFANQYRAQGQAEHHFTLDHSVPRRVLIIPVEQKFQIDADNKSIIGKAPYPVCFLMKRY